MRHLLSKYLHLYKNFCIQTFFLPSVENLNLFRVFIIFCKIVSLEPELYWKWKLVWVRIDCAICKVAAAVRTFGQVLSGMMHTLPPEHIGMLRVTLPRKKIPVIIIISLHICIARPTHSLLYLTFSTDQSDTFWSLWEASRWESGLDCGPYWQTSDTAACSLRQLQIRTTFCIFYQRRDQEKRTRLADQLDRRNLTEYYGWRINLLSNFVQKIFFNHYHGLRNKPEPAHIL